MDQHLPPLTTVTEGSREGSEALSSDTTRTMETMMSALVTMMGDIKLHFEEGTRRRRKKEQEREGLSVARNAGSSTSAYPVLSRADKAPMYTPEEQRPPDRRPNTQLFPDGGRSETPPERVETEAPNPFHRRLEIPEFDGSGTEGWLSRVEQFFEGNYCTDQQKVVAVRESFIGDALDWYLWQKERDPFSSWASMKQRILSRFATYHDESAGERLLNLRQTGAVEEYCRNFVKIAATAPELPEITLELAFITGLNPKLRTRIKVMEPKGLDRWMSLAQRMEMWDGETEEATGTSRGVKGLTERVGFVKGSNPSPGYKNPNGLAFSKPTTSQQMTRPNPTLAQNTEGRNSLGHNRVKPPFRRLTPAEIAVRKAERLCFRCDDKGHSAQNCPHKELRLLIVEDDGSEMEWDGIKEVGLGEELREECGIAVLSINSMAGLSSPRTLKLRGNIRGVPVVVMVDFGVTHNFVSESLVRSIPLTVENTGGYGVVTGTGVTVRSQGVCREVHLHIQGTDIRADFLPLGLGSADVILGVQWLETLGDVKANWKLHRLQFKINGQKIRL